MERKSCWPLILCISVVMGIGLLGYMHLKKELVYKLTSEMEFVEAAVRETLLGIENFNLAVQHTETELGNADKEIKTLQDENGKLNSALDGKKKEVKACKDSVAGLNNDIKAVEKDKGDTDGRFAGEKTKWVEEINVLKRQFQEHSPVCAHVKIRPEEKDPTIYDLCPQIQNKTTAAVTVSQGKV
ncbi:uncharacterized protein si:ch73-347e22.8 [Pseudorasbora parva]|uniref:uncharacterized protein si:ch73-347e22.8 n=1 Tax=Pseudorasbora parva TaxID=51549 RepID=UPI00351EA9C0